MDRGIESEPHGSSSPNQLLSSVFRESLQASSSRRYRSKSRLTTGHINLDSKSSTSNPTINPTHLPPQTSSLLPSRFIVSVFITRIFKESQQSPQQLTANPPTAHNPISYPKPRSKSILIADDKEKGLGQGQLKSRSTQTAATGKRVAPKRPPDAPPSATTRSSTVSLRSIP